MEVTIAQKVKVAAYSGYDLNEDRTAEVLLLENGEWILSYSRMDGEEKKEAAIRLTPSAFRATLRAIDDIQKETRKPI